MSEHVARENAAGVVMLAPSDPERLRAQLHASGCSACASELATASRALECLAVFESGMASSPARLREMERSIQEAIRSESRGASASAAGPSWQAALAAVACAVLAGVIFRGFAEDVLSWVAAGAALVLGVGAILSVRDGASGRTAAWVASAGALALAVISVEPGDAVEWRHAGFCAGTQLATALAPALVALRLGDTSSGTSGAGWAIAGRGAGGALVALSALTLVCPAHSALHVVFFHVVSIAGAAAIATLVARGLRWSEAA